MQILFSGKINNYSSADLHLFTVALFHSFSEQSFQSNVGKYAPSSAPKQRMSTYQTLQL